MLDNLRRMTASHRAGPGAAPPAPGSLQVVQAGPDVILPVWAKPRASKSRIGGLREGALEVSVAAPPVDGEANDELVRTVARALGVPRASVAIESGSTGRTKRLRIRSATVDGVLAKLGLRG
jgi:uncharacterized protein (TIGR00251 family)